MCDRALNLPLQYTTSQIIVRSHVKSKIFPIKSGSTPSLVLTIGITQLQVPEFLIEVSFLVDTLIHTCPCLHSVWDL